MSSQVNDVFNAFVEAQKAMQRLPEAELELAKAKAEIDFKEARLNDYRHWHDDMSAQIVALKDEIKAKEDALASATFRESEVRTKLEMLVGTFNTVIGEAKAAVELIEPPKVEEQTAPLADGSGSESNWGLAPIRNFDANTTPPNESFSGSSGSFEATEGISVQPNPTPADGSGQTGEQTPETQPSTSEVDPSATHPIDAVPVEHIGSTTPTMTADAPAHTANAKPYWLKPDSITWVNWINLGNDYPQWINADGSPKPGYGSF